MLLLKERLENMPVMSLQTGAAIAHTGEMVIDPRQLKLVAFYCNGPRLDVNPAILNVSDIREISDLGLIVDSADVLMSPDDLVRLKEVLDFRFVLQDKPVITKSGHKVGKVVGFALDNTTLYVVKLHVRPGGWKAFQTTELVVDRTQIVRVTDTEVVVADAAIKDKAEEQKPVAAPVIENPFRHAPVEGTSPNAKQ